MSFSPGVYERNLPLFIEEKGIMVRLPATLALLVLGACSLSAQSDGYWKYSARKEWKYAFQPGRTDARASQNIAEQTLDYTYEYYDVNGTGKWLTDVVRFQWDMLNPANSLSILPKQGNGAPLYPGQTVRFTGATTFTGQYYSSGNGRIYVGEPPLQTPNGWKSDGTLYPTWGYYTDAILWIDAGRGATQSASANYVIPKGPLTAGPPLTIRCVTGIQGSAAVEYIYDWVPPSPPAITAVTHNTTGKPSITPGSWFTVWGTNLASKTREWTTADFNGKQLPTSLENIQVLVHGRPALISFISPGQINALAPSDAFVGDVDVQVIAANGTKSLTYTVALAKLAPGLFQYQVAGAKYVVSHVGSEFIGKPGLVTGLTTRPVKPGEVITLYGTGFGPASQPFAPETTVSGYSVLGTPVDFKIGGAAATVLWAGQTGSGLYQFNVQAPDVAAGDQEIIASIGGVATPTGVSITMQR